MIEKLAPHMAITLKEREKWDQPDVSHEDVPFAMKRVTNLSEVNLLDPEKIDALMEELGELECELSSTATTEEEKDESRHALANMFVDIDISAANEVMKVSSLQKTSSGLQPQWEGPNKNRGKRFAAGELTLDKSTIDSDHQVQDLQFWTLHSTTKALVSAKVFLLGQVCLVLSEGMPCRSAEKNPSTGVVLTIYDYNPDTSLYHENGRTSLMQATTVLHCNVTALIHFSDDKAVSFSHVTCKDLDGYIPFSANVNIEERLEVLGAGTQAMIDEEDEEEIEEIVKKQFNSRLNQYEYLVKWKGYSSKHNTWELITNIPDDLFCDFEVHSIMASLLLQKVLQVFMDCVTGSP